jgi:hypothetical protein
MKTRSTYAYVDDEESELQLNIKTRLLANDLRYVEVRRLGSTALVRVWIFARYLSL